MNLASYILMAQHIAHGLPALFKMELGDHNNIADRRLRFMVNYAYKNVPLYRRKYDEAGINPGDIRGIGDLTRLPLITKKDLVDGYPHDILSQKLKPSHYRLISTSGSTGSPVRIFKSRSQVSAAVVGSIFMNRLLAVYLHIETPIKKVLSIFVEAPDSLEGINTSEKRRIPASINRNNLDIDATEPPNTHIEALNSFRPDAVFTYPSVLRNMAIHVQQHNIAVHQPKLLMVSGELLDNNTRQTIGRVFKGKLMNLYICTECGPIATECTGHSGMHVLSTKTILELLKDGKPVAEGESGDVVVTDLWNQATPIIRYTGLKDVARFSTEKYDCKRKTPILKVVEGRSVDSVILRDGRLLHPFSLTLALEHIDDIACFQIIQESLDKLKVLVVPEKEGSSEQSRAIMDSLSKVLGEGINIDTSFVSEIPHHSNGQSHHVVVSRVRQNSFN